jgi:hypothetical protein
MIILLHIVIALASIVLATYALFRPSRRVIQTSYVLIGLTLTSGLYLVISAPAHIIEVCTVGVAYLIVASFVTIAARIKLTRLTGDTTKLEG